MHHHLDPQRMLIETHQDRVRELTAPGDLARSRRRLRLRVARRLRAPLARRRPSDVPTRTRRRAPGRRLSPGTDVSC